MLYTRALSPWSFCEEDDEVRSSRPVRARIANSRVAISLTDTTNKAGVAASCTRLLLLWAVLPGRSLLAHGSESLRLEEFDTLLDASPPLSSVPCSGLPLVHANTALLLVAPEGFFHIYCFSRHIMYNYQRETIEATRSSKRGTDPRKD